MRLIYISQTCPPEPGATKRPLKQAQVLVELGHDVTLITGFPSYPLGRIAPMYRGRLRARETADGVDVLRVWCFPAPNRGWIRRIAGFATFAMHALIAALGRPRAGAVIASVPKPLTELAGWAASRLTGAAFVLEMRDVLPDNLELVNIRDSSIVYRMLKKYYRWVYHRADLIAVTTPGERLKMTAYGVNESRITIVPHAVDTGEVNRGRRDPVRRHLGVEDAFVAVYAGSFSPYYRVPWILEAAHILQNRFPRFKLLLIGTGHDFPQVRSLVESGQLTNVTLIGGVPPDEVFDYLQAADLFLYPQVTAEVVHGTKVFEYMAVGRPILCICDRPDEQLAERLEVGISVDSRDAYALARTIEQLANDPILYARWAACGPRMISAGYDRPSVVRAFAEKLLLVGKHPDCESRNGQCMTRT